ncbi:O-Antigen ligase [compost metagenome]
MKSLKATIEPLYFFVLCGTIVSLFVHPKLSSIGIILLSLVWIADGFTREKVHAFAAHPFFIACSVLFVSYLASWLLSADKTAAAFAIEKKLALPLLPAIILSMPAITQKRLQQLFTLFISATVVTMFVALLISLYQYHTSGEVNGFFYHNLVSGVHLSAITASCFCLISLVLVAHSTLRKSYRIIAGLFLILFLLLLSSKMFLFLLLVLWITYVCSLKVMRYRIILLSVFIMGLLLIMTTSNPLKNRFADISRFNTERVLAHQYKAEDYFDGLSMRLVYVRFSKEIIQEHHALWLGVGTGDAEALLQQKIVQSGMYTGNGTSDKGYLEYGFHNQYIQVWVQMGLLGLCIYLLLLGIAWAYAFSKAAKWLAGILLIFTIGALTDTWLEVQTGLMLFLLFISLGIRQAPTINSQSLSS